MDPGRARRSRTALPVAPWLPWLGVALATAAGLALLPALARRLPADAVRPAATRGSGAAG